MKRVSVYDESNSGSRKCLFPIHTPSQSLCELLKCTQFTKREIKLMYRTFKQDCPSGLLQEDTFKIIFARIFPFGDVNLYAHYVFKTFDQNKNEAISFKDFLEWLSLLCHGSKQEKIKWAFRLYDINQDGFITRKELREILYAVYALIGKQPSQATEERNMRDHVDRIFQKMDINNDGVVTFDEFMETCAQDESISKSLAIFHAMMIKTQ